MTVHKDVVGCFGKKTNVKPCCWLLTFTTERVSINYNKIQLHQDIFTSKLRLRVDDISDSFWSRTNLKYKPKLAFVKRVETQQNDG